MNENNHFLFLIGLLSTLKRGSDFGAAEKVAI
jgi:hypothetical protein